MLIANIESMGWLNYYVHIIRYYVSREEKILKSVTITKEDISMKKIVFFLTTFVFVVISLSICFADNKGPVPCEVLADQIQEGLAGNYTFNQHFSSVKCQYSGKYRTLLIDIRGRDTDEARTIANDIAKAQRDKLDENKHPDVRIIVRILYGPNLQYVIEDTMYALGPQVYVDVKNEINNPYENKDTDMELFAFPSFDYLVPEGGTIKIDAKNVGIKGKVDISYEIIDPSIAIFDKGKVTGKKEGITELMAVAVDTSGKEYKAFCRINTIIPAQKIYFEMDEYEGRTDFFSDIIPNVIIEPENATIKNYEIESAYNSVITSHIRIQPKDVFTNKQMTVKTVDGTNLKDTAKLSCPPMGSSHKGDIVIDSPEGYDLTYWFNGKIGSNYKDDLIYCDICVGESIKTNDFPSIRGDETRLLHLTPIKEGTGELYFTYNNRKILSFNVIVTADAIKDNSDSFFGIGD